MCFGLFSFMSFQIQWCKNEQHSRGYKGLYLKQLQRYQNDATRTETYFKDVCQHVFILIVRTAPNDVTSKERVYILAVISVFDFFFHNKRIFLFFIFWCLFVCFTFSFFQKVRTAFNDVLNKQRGSCQSSKLKSFYLKNLSSFQWKSKQRGQLPML